MVDSCRQLTVSQNNGDEDTAGMVTILTGQQVEELCSRSAAMKVSHSRSSTVKLNSLKLQVLQWCPRCESLKYYRKLLYFRCSIWWFVCVLALPGGGAGGELGGHGAEEHRGVLPAVEGDRLRGHGGGSCRCCEQLNRSQHSLPLSLPLFCSVCICVSKRKKKTTKERWIEVKESKLRELEKKIPWSKKINNTTETRGRNGAIR